MPDILTHIAFADEVLENLKDDSLRKQIQKRNQLFRLGAQGPDFFFYHKFLFGKDDLLKEMGRFMHEKETGSFLKCSFEGLYHEDERQWAYYDLLSYFAGFLCHYILDKNTHPFIYCFSGYAFREGSEEGVYGRVHKRMENVIDVDIWHNKKGKAAYKERVDKLIDIKEGFPHHLIEHLRKTIKNVYKTELSSKEIETSYRHMIKALRLLYDPLNLKKSFLKGVENIMGKNIDTGKPFYPVTAEAGQKYLNTEKRSWTHPLDDTKIYNTSFIELYENAKIEGIYMLSEILKRVRTQKPIPIELIGNRSYLTNMIWDTKENKVQAVSAGLLMNER